MPGQATTNPPAKPESLHLSDRFTRAIDYARTLHIERRKGSDIPFIAHLLGVASLVMGEAGHVPFPVTEDMVIAALLHDSVEDHGGATRLHDVSHNFGRNVARMVEGLSDTVVEDPNQKEPWEERKQKYLHHLRSQPADVQLISAADKLYNARTILDDYRKIGSEVWKRFKRGRDLQLWYFRELLTIFNSSGTNRIVEEFDRVVAALKRISADESKTPDPPQPKPRTR
ncbi:MAG: HD domain-containing protein [Terracidiphilus sp.]